MGYQTLVYLMLKMFFCMYDLIFSVSFVQLGMIYFRLQEGSSFVGGLFKLGWGN